ncbi:hypothetical protein K503DRAFT_429723 [Rhizopogon vinicolor AM-OR11-026]|uniref:Uncharacterized protein n=1 Tax=Rhizopogon vinicolor AM-OR11-026 TaxID=1314800 RepID=A0A1B7MPX3_9AGAM|nr:hypothetical protein K503DRAFT_429723 [Rhizopogon vinicolor AM-OR11-026]
MNLEGLLLTIVEMLDDESEQFVKKALTLWNLKLKPTQGNPTKFIRRNIEDDVTQIRAQRAARRSAPSGGLTNTSNGILRCIRCQTLLTSTFRGSISFRHYSQSSTSPSSTTSRLKRLACAMSDEPEVQLEVPPPKRPPMDHTDACCPPSPDTSRMMMKVSLRVCLDLNSQLANQFEIWSTMESRLSLNASATSLIIMTKTSHQLRNLTVALFPAY